MKESVIRIENLTKRFFIPQEKRHSIKEHVLGFGSKVGYKEFLALSNISFDVQKGEWIGIIGPNGSGKSTLLKLIANIYQPDAGTISVRGTLVPFLELGVGFNSELSARDNIYLNGIILGMTRKELKDTFDEIVAYAGFPDFLYQKLKNYSSGMQIRLAFAIAIQSRGDLYLLDEALSVGDREFQFKTRKEFTRMKAEGKSALIVGHDFKSIRENCDRVIYLDKGKIVLIDTPEKAFQAYEAVSDGRVLP